jgi:hypothetical protein
VCSRSDHSLCTLFKGGRRGNVGAIEYTAHLPAGNYYDAVFLDAFGREVIPTTVTEVVELTFCNEEVFEVTLFGKLLPIPPASRPVLSPVRVPSPVQQPASAPGGAVTIGNVPVKAPIRVPVRAPIPGTVRVPVRVPVRPSAPVPVRAPAPAPRKTPVRIPVQTPISVPVKSPTAKTPVGKKAMKR